MATAARATLLTVLALAGGCALARSGLGDGEGGTAPPVDAGRDGGPPRDGSAGTDSGLDAGRLDAGRLDAGFDAGRLDAGRLDAGFDAGPGPCPGACSAGAEQTEPCGDCGMRTRSCTASCTWGAWGACTGEGACAPGTVEMGAACGRCGTSQRTCQDDCNWGSSTCTGEGVCSPGASDTTSCGRCDNGTVTRTCTTACTWSSTGMCTGEVYCTYGSIVRCPGGWSGSYQCCSDGDWERGGC